MYFYTLNLNFKFFKCSELDLHQFVKYFFIGQIVHHVFRIQQKLFHEKNSRRCVSWNSIARALNKQNLLDRYAQLLKPKKSVYGMMKIKHRSSQHRCLTHLCKPFTNQKNSNHYSEFNWILNLYPFTNTVFLGNSLAQ